MRTSGLWSIAALVVAVVVGCDDGPQSSTDGQTHWLEPCRASAKCRSGLECTCGICTRACTANQDCSLGHTRAECVQGTELTNRCPSASPSAGLCLPLDAGDGSFTDHSSAPGPEAGPPSSDGSDGSSSDADTRDAKDVSVGPDTGRDADRPSTDIDGGATYGEGGISHEGGADALTPVTEGGASHEGGDAVGPCADDDNDGVCNVVDVCPGFDDKLDDDDDGRPNGCEPVLLLDINTKTGDSNPMSMAATDTSVFIAANNGDVLEDREVWMTDVAGGTPKKVSDVNQPSGYNDIYLPTPVGDRLFFFTEGAHPALWVTGASGTAVELKTGAPPFEARAAVATKDRFFFIVYSGSENQVWASDGTEAGTVLLNASAYMGGNNDPTMTAVGDLVYFAAFTGRIELWRSDGTPAGTLAVTSDPGVEYANTHIAELGGRVYFAAAARGAPPMAVWSTDGTPQGTRPAFSNPPAGFDPIQVWSTKTHLFMLSASSGNPPVKGFWTSVGEGVAPVQLDLGTPLLLDTSSRVGATVGESAYLWTTSGIWRCDGLSVPELIYTGGAGTNLLYRVEIFPAATGAYFFGSPDGSTDHLFRIDDSAVTDLTPNGVALQDLRLPPNLGFQLGVVSGDRLFFVQSSPGHGYEPWVSDGTVSGTHELADINAMTKDSAAGSFSSTGLAGGPVIFSARTDENGREPWITGGDGATTRLLLDTAPGPEDGFSNPWVTIDQEQFFVARSSASGSNSVYRVDAQGHVVELPSDIKGAPAPRPAHAGAQVFYEGPSIGPIMSVPLTSLTGPSPTLVGSTYVQTDTLVASPPIALITEWKGSTWFIRGGSPGPFYLWRTDGTIAGSEVVREVKNAALIPIGDVLYYQGIDFELYRTDGSSAPPERVTDVVSQGQCFCRTPSIFKEPFQDRVYFGAMDAGGAVNRLYRTNATGSELFADIDVVTHPVVIGPLMYMVDALFSLWVTDGTASGTKKLFDGVGTDARVVSYKGLAYFAAADSAHGYELWRSDGTAAGTVMEADLSPGPTSSNPTNFFAMPDALYFTADTPQYGNEPWVLRR